MTSIFSRMVAAVDNSEPSTRSTTLAARIASESLGTLVLCHAIDWNPVIRQLERGGMAIDPTVTMEAFREHGRTLLSEATDAARAHDVVPRVALVEGEPAESIVRLAAELRAGLIVVGTHNREDPEHAQLGNTTSALLRASTLPVMTVRPGMTLPTDGRRCIERVLVAADASDPADAALQAAFTLPPEYRRALTVCSVADPRGEAGLGVTGRERLQAQCRFVVERSLDLARAQGIDARGRVLTGEPCSTIIAAARAEGADLIIIGTHGRRGPARHVLGSVAEGVVRSAHLPVLVVRIAALEPNTAIRKARAVAGSTRQ